MARSACGGPPRHAQLRPSRDFGTAPGSPRHRGCERSSRRVCTRASRSLGRCGSTQRGRHCGCRKRKAIGKSHRSRELLGHASERDQARYDIRPAVRGRRIRARRLRLRTTWRATPRSGSRPRRTRSTISSTTWRAGLHLVHLTDDLTDEVVRRAVRRPCPVSPRCGIRACARAISIGCSGIGERIGVRRVVPLVGPRGAQLARGLAGRALASARCRTEPAARNFSFTIGCVSASSVVSQTDPHHTPCAPSAIAAAICRPRPMPPAASTGVGATASTTSGTSTIVAISPVCPPAS